MTLPTVKLVEGLEAGHWKRWNSRGKDSEMFTVAEATDIMMSNNSRIRLIGIGAEVYAVCLL